MPFKYQVYAAYPMEEVGNENMDSIGLADLIVLNNVGRRPGKFSYARDFQTFQNDIRDTYIQSSSTKFNTTTFSTWMFFESDIPVSDAVLLSRGQWGTPIWSIRTISGRIAFEMGDGIGGSQSIIGPQVLQGDHFVGVSYDDTTGAAVLYYDGSVVATGTNPIIMPTIDMGIAYGAYVDGGLPWNGFIDECLWTNLILDTTDWDTIWNDGDGHDVPWYYPDNIFGKICVIKHDRIMVMERIETCIVEHDRIMVMERIETYIVEHNKNPIVSVKHGRR